VCRVGTCDTGYGDCNGTPADGCETDLYSTAQHCGACGNACNLPHATETCASGVCQVGTCDAGYANCDGQHANGCETNLDADGGTCAGAINLGSVCGDDGCRGGPSAAGRGEAWYRVRLDECSNLVSDLRLTVRLTPPSGADYDLYVWEPCGTMVGFSNQGGSATETLNFVVNDSWGSDDTTTFFIEIRWYSGDSCANWALTTSGDCGG
jgi:hypothetical protein